MITLKEMVVIFILANGETMQCRALCLVRETSFPKTAQQEGSHCWISIPSADIKALHRSVQARNLWNYLDLFYRRGAHDL